MAMPWQLRRGLMERRKSRRREPRPIAESMPSISINDLKIPRDYATITLPNAGLKYPQLASMKLTYHSVEVTHTTGRKQHFKLKPIKTHFGRPRYAFICNCGRPVIKMYFRYGNLACKRCHNAVMLSQKLDKHRRPILKAHRLETFLALKTNIQQRTRARLIKRYGEKAAMPLSNYRTRTPALWK
jgi:hypothetical protein